MASELEDLKKALLDMGGKKYAKKVDELIKTSQMGDPVWTRQIGLPKPQTDVTPTKEWPTAAEKSILEPGWMAQKPIDYSQSLQHSTESHIDKIPNTTRDQIAVLLKTTKEGLGQAWHKLVDLLVANGIENKEIAEIMKTDWPLAASKLGYAGDADTSMLSYVKSVLPKLEKPKPNSQPGSVAKTAPTSLSQIRGIFGLDTNGQWDSEMAKAWEAFVNSLTPVLLATEQAESVKSSWQKAAPSLGYPIGNYASMLKFIQESQAKVKSGVASPAQSTVAPGTVTPEGTPATTPEATPVTEDDSKIDLLKYIADSIRLMMGSTGDKLKFNTPFRSEKRQVSRWVKRFFDGNVDAAAKAALDVGGEGQWLPLVKEDMSLLAAKDQKGRSLRSGAFFGGLYQTLRGGAKEMRQSLNQGRKAVRKSAPKPAPKPATKRAPPKAAPKPQRTKRRASERLDRLETLHKEASKKK